MILLLDTHTNITNPWFAKHFDKAFRFLHVIEYRLFI